MIYINYDKSNSPACYEILDTEKYIISVGTTIKECIEARQNTLENGTNGETFPVKVSKNSIEYTVVNTSYKVLLLWSGETLPSYEDLIKLHPEFYL